MCEALRYPEYSVCTLLDLRSFIVIYTAENICLVYFTVFILFICEIALIMVACVFLFAAICHQR